MSIFSSADSAPCCVMPIHDGCVTTLREGRGGFPVVEANWWLLIGTIEQWESAQGADVRAVG